CQLDVVVKNLPIHLTTSWWWLFRFREHILPAPRSEQIPLSIMVTTLKRMSCCHNREKSSRPPPDRPRGSPHLCQLKTTSRCRTAPGRKLPRAVRTPPAATGWLCHPGRYDKCHNSVAMKGSRGVGMGINLTM